MNTGLSGGLAGMPSTVAIVVPTLGRQAALRRLLASIERAIPDGLAAEIAVVVNGSRAAGRLSPPSWAEPQTAVGPGAPPRAPHPLRWVERPEAGRAGACNAGASATSGELIVFLDDDMEPSAGWLEAHLAAHATTEPRLVMGAVPVAVADRKAAAGGYVGRRFDRHLAKLSDPGHAIEPSDVFTGNASIRRTTFEAVGGFDERLTAYGNEDRELARRLRAAGVGLVYEPAAKAVQHYEKDLAALAADSRAKGRSAVAVAGRDPAAAADTRLARIGSRRRRLVRSLVIRGEAVIPGLQAAVLHGAGAAARWTGGRFDPLLEFALDVEFWRGVSEAHREDRSAPSEPAARGEVAARPRLIVHYLGSRDFGGAERVLVWLLANLPRDRWRSIVFHDPAAVRLTAELARLGIEARPLAIGGGPRAWFQVPALGQAIRQLHPDLVHVHRPWPAAGRAALVATQLGGAPIVVTDHLAPVRVGWRRRLVQRLAEARVTRFVAVSDDVAAQLDRTVRTPQRRLRVVQNGIPVADYVRPADGRLRARLAPGGQPLVVVIAQFRPQKGYDVLMRAAAELPGVTFALAGEGPERPAIEALGRDLGVADRVTFLGFVDDPAALLAVADLVVLPSRFEGLPIVVLEAQAACRPVVATDVQGTRRAISDGVEGLLVPADDPPALAAAIRRVIDDPALARRLADAGHARVTAEFDVRTMTLGVEAVYREVLDASTRRRRGRSLPRRPALRLRRGGRDPVRNRGAMPEAERNLSLRRLDLRVLTGHPVPVHGIALGRAPAELETALRLLGDESEADERAPVDFVAVHVEGRSDLNDAFDRLAPGGALLAAWDRAAARPAERATQLAGFEAARAFRPWPWPRRGTPVAWLPCATRAPLNYVFSLGEGRNPALRVLRHCRRWLWIAADRLGVSPLVVIAARPLPGAPPAADARPNGTDAPADATGITTWAVLSMGRRSRNRIVALGFQPAARQPARVLKMARVPEAVAGLAREAAALDAASRLRPLGIPGVPRLITFRSQGLATKLEELAIDGRPLSPTLDDRSLPRQVHAIAVWTAGLADVGRRLASVDLRDRHVDPVLAAFEASYGEAVGRETVARAQDALLPLDAVPSALEHRDLAPWNIRLDPDGQIAVLDWESAEPDGIAGLDLAYVLAYLAFDVRRARSEARMIAVYRDLLASEQAPHNRWLQEARIAYASATGLALLDLRRLAVLAWLIHSKSEYERIAADAGHRPLPARLKAGLFVGLLEAELGALAQEERARAMPVEATEIS